MKSLYLLFFLCLLLVAGRELTAQNRPDKSKKPAKEHFQLTGLKISGNGRWLTAWKSYDLNQDTLLIFDSQAAGKPACCRVKAECVAFLNNDRVLIKNPQQVELLNLANQTAESFQGVKHLQLLNNKKQFVLLYDEKRENTLEQRNINGELINETSGVSRFYITKDDLIYVATENKNNVFEVLQIGEQNKKLVYQSGRKVLSLTVDPGGTGIMVHEQNPEDSSPNVVYLDLITKTSFSLTNVLSTPFQQAFTEVISEGSSYFLKLWVQRQPKDTSLIDIWYGNDNRLEEKFCSPIDVLTYIWEPRNHFIRKVGTDRLPVNINTGNDRYFLSFDPYSLQDYRTERTPLQLYVYDLVENRYALLDTIAPKLYLSGDGTYALSPGSGGWYLYHIPSASKKLIDRKDLGTPWFTEDGTAVLFGGEGSVWQYEIKTATLSRVVSFDGYQTNIVNGQWNDISTNKSRIAKHRINLSQPLLIELYDPKENRTGYVLWNKGETEVIVPPTSKHIQSLIHDDNYQHFSYIEEDYNLPPRLVFKNMGKEQTILYRSNRQDKAILSLRREIISYTNSDGFTLKGILYYPLNYDSSRKYPIVVHIYEKQNQLANRYPCASYYECLGFNIRLFLENGYFVYLPDIMILGDAGPGMDALDCVNRALDAVLHNPVIDLTKIGLIGHSFGGYEADYIATRSNRFAAFVSGSGHSDIVWDANSFNYNFHTPDYMRIEANMYKMGKPFFVDKGLYFKNNPAYHAEKVNAPVLLWTGLEDLNVTADHSMAFYNALRRNQKEVIALFFKGEGHYLQQKQAQFDLTCRILDWFGFFLKGNTDCEWINKGIYKKDAP